MASTPGSSKRTTGFRCAGLEWGPCTTCAAVGAARGLGTCYGGHGWHPQGCPPVPPRHDSTSRPLPTPSSVLRCPDPPDPGHPGTAPACTGPASVGPAPWLPGSGGENRASRLEPLQWPVCRPSLAPRTPQGSTGIAPCLPSPLSGSRSTSLGSTRYQDPGRRQPPENSPLPASPQVAVTVGPSGSERGDEAPVRGVYQRQTAVGGGRGNAGKVDPAPELPVSCESPSECGPLCARGARPDSRPVKSHKPSPRRRALQHRGGDPR